LVNPSHDEYRELNEQMLWLRKLAEHLVVLVLFAERDTAADYWLWMILTEYREAERLKTALGRELLFPPTHSQLRHLMKSSSTVPAGPEILRGINVLYQRSNTVSKPWFVTERRWKEMLEGEVASVKGWQPLRMRDLMERAGESSHPLESTVLGHYQITYGRYSSDIHAVHEGATAGRVTEDQVLWFSVLAVLHRLSELIDFEQGAVQRLTASVISYYADEFRLDGSPEVGEMVNLLGDEDFGATVLEVAPNAGVAVVKMEEDKDVLLKRGIEMVRRGPAS
jgi:hypothetical protein